MKANMKKISLYIYDARLTQENALQFCKLYPSPPHNPFYFV